LRFSASRLKTWMTCPLQAKFRYEDHEPRLVNAKAAFGTAVHSGLQIYNTTGDVEKGVAQFLDLWTNPEKMDSVPQYWPRNTSYGGLRKRGQDIIRDVHERTAWDTRVVVATEHPFLVPFGEHELTGFVDLVEVRRSGKGKDILRIVDYKTSSYQPNMGALALDVQFTIYIYASTCREFWYGNGVDFPPVDNVDWAFEMYDDLPRRAIWYHLWGMKEVDAGPRADKDFMRLYRVCEQVAAAQEAGIYVPKIGENCTLCDYQEPCGVEIPTAEQLREQEDAWI
jgi:hypothetical protein